MSALEHAATKARRALRHGTRYSYARLVARLLAVRPHQATLSSILVARRTVICRFVEPQSTIGEKAEPAAFKHGRPPRAGWAFGLETDRDGRGAAAQPARAS